MTRTAVAAPAPPTEPRGLYVLRLEKILRELVEASDGGSDTYDVRELVEEARALLNIPPPPWRRA